MSQFTLTERLDRVLGEAVVSIEAILKRENLANDIQLRYMVMVVPVVVVPESEIAARESHDRQMPVALAGDIAMSAAKRLIQSAFEGLDVPAKAST